MLSQLLRLTKLMIMVVMLVLAVTVGLLVLYLHNWETPSVVSSPERDSTPATLVTTPTWAPQEIEKDLPSGPRGEQIRYGYDLITETYQHLGPELNNPQQIYTGNNLACKNCHLESGTKASAAAFVGVFQRFPQFRARQGGEGTLEERVNGCMERSMNGRKLAEDSPEMRAVLAYMQWLSEDVPEEELDHYRGFTSINLPDRMADTVAGRTIYEQRCAVCHSDDGLGQRVGETGDRAGYVYPPLWGADTYNHGAGMNRVITAARFIKGNMPLGATAERPLLTDEEAYDVAAFINSHTRPLKENTEKDYPNLSLKPIDAPYGPYPDTFPASQHRFGPFAPLQEYYNNLKDTYVP